MARILVKKVDQPAEVREIEATYRCDCKSLIMGNGDLIEYADLMETTRSKDHSVLCVMVDEEGMLKDYPQNALLPTVKGIEPIYGDFVIMRYFPENVMEKEIWDFKLTSLTKHDVLYLKKLLDKNGKFQQPISPFL